MSTKTRALSIIAAALMLSVVIGGAVAAQDATATVEPSPAAATPESTVAPSVVSVTPEATTQTTNPPNAPMAHAFLGVQLQDATGGASVAQVVPNSPAATAGLQVNDLITAINGTTINNAADAAQLVGGLAPGAQVTIDVTRGSSKMTVTATLGSQQGNPGQPMRPGQPMQPGQPGRNGQPGQGRNGNGGMAQQFGQVSPILRMMASTGTLGVNIQDINAQVAQTNKLTVTDGALVKSVTSGSAADKAGLKVNDVITAVDGTKVDARHPLTYLLLPYQPGDSVTLSILRAGASQDVTATLDKQTRPMMGGFGGMFPFMFRLPFGFGGRGGFFGGRGGFPFGMGGRQGQGRSGQGQNNNGQPMQATPEATPNT